MAVFKNPNHGYRTAEGGVPAYAAALGVRHSGEMQFIQEVNGRLVFLPPGLMAKITAENNKQSPPPSQPMVQKPSTNESETKPTGDSSRWVRNLFLTIDEQAQTIFEWAKQEHWLGITRWEFEAMLGEAASKAHNMEWPNDHFTAITLVPYLPSRYKFGSKLFRTYEFLYRKIERACRQNDLLTGRWAPIRSLETGETLLEHHPDARVFHSKVTIDVELIDLGHRPRQVHWRNKGHHLPTAGVLASLALHTKWLVAIDGESVPFVSVPGYRLVDARNSKNWGIMDFRKSAGLDALIIDRCTENFPMGNRAVPLLKRASAVMAL
ncbi:hypothetical protein KKF05_03335 [Patescibacteria group bacterium]|nr:hypothetical protein [Patescibacteria group bacterium]MBU1029444.1 hypothetical protein [Patescibacteria group bacterium]MBU1915757.1 hypothetical protein [Patescibacteria group bacterium]